MFVLIAWWKLIRGNDWGWLWRKLYVEYKITRKPNLFFLYRFLFPDIP